MCIVLAETTLRATLTLSDVTGCSFFQFEFVCYSLLSFSWGSHIDKEWDEYVWGGVVGGSWRRELLHSSGEGGGLPVNEAETHIGSCRCAHAALREPYFSVCLSALPPVGWTCSPCCRVNSFALQIGFESLWRDASEAIWCYQQRKLHADLSLQVNSPPALNVFSTRIASDNRHSGLYLLALARHAVHYLAPYF